MLNTLLVKYSSTRVTVAYRPALIFLKNNPLLQQRLTVLSFSAHLC